MIARAKGPEAIPARTDAPPNRESKPPAAATIAIIVTPTGFCGFDWTVVMCFDIPLG
jgi:hypothetical protein